MTQVPTPDTEKLVRPDIQSPRRRPRRNSVTIVVYFAITFAAVSSIWLVFVFGRAYERPPSFTYSETEFVVKGKVGAGEDLLVTVQGETSGGTNVTELILVVSCNGANYRRPVEPPGGLSKVPSVNAPAGPFSFTMAIRMPDDLPSGADCVYTHVANQQGSRPSGFTVRFQTHE